MNPPTYRKTTTRIIGNGVIVVSKGGKGKGKTKGRGKPYDPAEEARKLAKTRATPALWGVNEEALKLDANADVRSEAQTREKTRRVTRYDCFGILYSRGALADDKDTATARLAAVRRLEETLARRMRLEGLPALVGGGKPIPVSDRSLAAAQTVEDIAERAGPLSFNLICALVEPSVKDGQPVNNWRGTVQRVTGEFRHVEQACLVRAAAQNLLDAWQAFDKHGPAQRRAA